MVQRLRPHPDKMKPELIWNIAKGVNYSWQTRLPTGNKVR